MAIFQAKYGGNCGACGERIHVGDLVTYSDDVVVHADCEDTQPERKAEVCTTCWLTKPCECDDDATGRGGSRVRGGGGVA